MKTPLFPLDRDHLRSHLGSMPQLCGIKRCRLEDGRADGVEILEVVTGSGLDFTVLPGRCMDVAWVRYRGVPVSFMSKAEVAAGAYAQEADLEWLRDFHGGMLTTCGFLNLGGDCRVPHPIYADQHHCVHGRLAHIPASQVGYTCRWEGERYVMEMTGLVRHSAFEAENLTLRRTIRAVLGEKKIHIHDDIENEGFEKQPFMLLYHMNFGYPLLSAASRLLIDAADVTPASDLAAGEMDLRARFAEPVTGYSERCYYYHPQDRGDGKATATLINDELKLGASITFDLGTLPCLTEWKKLEAGDYVLGVEPGSCFPLSRPETEKRGQLMYMQPGEQRSTDVVLELLDGEEEIARAEALHRR